ncbi:hypothetical protein CWI37_2240p0010 [Hamiltosporidium tvaerminnensis]|uniref:Uncharacterized protein n=1 Tax=Hamiltosporidium tvaerminnensis TaxID=1176355 RepID=A0A4Q9KU49_9MICR|nr:hypothetical protein CWI37_2240p0010 [Hamiltosporidium tvaerminnensis]
MKEAYMMWKNITQKEKNPRVNSINRTHLALKKLLKSKIYVGRNVTKKRLEEKLAKTHEAVLCILKKEMFIWGQKVCGNREKSK